MQTMPTVPHSILRWSPACRQLFGTLVWLPFHCFVLAVILFVFAITHYNGTRLTPISATVLIAMFVLCLLAMAFYALGVIVVGQDIAQRQDMHRNDKQSWLIILFVAGLLGPPLYWHRFGRESIPVR